MTIIKLAAAPIAAAALGLAVAATAHAGTNGPADILFKSPTENIWCDLAPNLDGAATCEIREHSWPTPLSRSGQACNFTLGGLHYNLFPGEPSDATCYEGAGLVDTPNVETLDYGQTRNFGAITCDSEPDGVTCTDSSTGHFFRLSSDTYQVG
jgi:hypothetical protein